MPVYEYKCNKCGKITDILHKMDEDCELEKCEHCCKGRLNRIMSPTPGRLAGCKWQVGMKPSEFVKKNTDHRG